MTPETTPNNAQQQKQREFMSLLTLTLEIAGLPAPEPGKYHTEGQMEVRAASIRTAYKFARQLMIDVSK
jgi:hypothetical protein